MLEHCCLITSLTKMKKFTLAIGLCSLFALSAAEISFRDDGTSLDSD